MTFVFCHCIFAANQNFEIMENKIILSPITIVRSDEYNLWLEQIKQLYRNSKIKASLKVNNELLEFYWQLGREMYERRIEEVWGSGIVEKLSSDLKSAFPMSKGFSTTNLWYIKKWYLFYYEGYIKLHQVGGELLKILFSVPWKHHCVIITKCKTIESALFYLNQTINNNLSRALLEKSISKNEYETKGYAVTNFKETLPVPQNMLAQEIIKDPYHFDFLSMREEYDEKELELSLSRNIEHFLLELGKGFAFVGRQVELRVSDTSYYVDMLFYHIRLKSYVVIELKSVDFKPEFVGKLNFYVNAVDNLLKQNDDNQTIGLLICQGKDNTKVEWSFKGLETPLGIAEYKLESYKSVLPTIEEVEEELMNKKKS